jgi:hypothetical protein
MWLVIPRPPVHIHDHILEFHLHVLPVICLHSLVSEGLKALKHAFKKKGDLERPAPVKGTRRNVRPRLSSQVPNSPLGISGESGTSDVLSTRVLLSYVAWY